MYKRRNPRQIVLIFILISISFLSLNSALRSNSNPSITIERKSSYIRISSSISIENDNNSIMIILNNLGDPVEKSMYCGQFFAQKGFDVYISNYLPVSMLDKKDFNPIDFVQNSIPKIGKNQTISILGFGFGANCALNLQSILNSSKIIAINPIANFSQYIQKNSRK